MHFLSLNFLFYWLPRTHTPHPIAQQVVLSTSLDFKIDYLRNAHARSHFSNRSLNPEPLSSSHFSFRVLADRISRARGHAEIETALSARVGCAPLD